MQVIETRELEGLKVYFSHTTTYSLISIPSLHYCFLWNLSKNEFVARREFRESITSKLDKETTAELTTSVYHYLMNGQ